MMSSAQQPSSTAISSFLRDWQKLLEDSLLPDIQEPRGCEAAMCTHCRKPFEMEDSSSTSPPVPLESEPPSTSTTPSSPEISQPETLGEENEKTSDPPKARLAFLKWHIVHFQAILWLPTIIFGIVVCSFSAAKPALFDQCDPWTSWDWNMGGKPRSPPTDPTACGFIDVLERPSTPTAILIYITTFSAIAGFRKTPEDLKRFMLGLMFITTIAIRCLSSFSGWTMSQTWPFLVFSSNSQGKAIWLWCLMSLWFWNWSYLGVYKDVYLEKETRSLHDETGATIWIFPEKKEAEREDGNKDDEKEEKKEEKTHWDAFYIPWQDVVVRLAYIHIVDNAIHIIWLRSYITNHPYTSYLNNSEILTAMLLVQALLYTYARMKSHIHFSREQDEECGLGSEKSSARVTVLKSWTKGLLARPAQQNFPVESTWWEHFLVLMFLVATTFFIIVFPLEVESPAFLW